MTQEQMKQYMQEMQIATAQFNLENLRISAVRNMFETKKTKLEVISNYIGENEATMDAIIKQREELMVSILAMKV